MTFLKTVKDFTEYILFRISLIIFRLFPAKITIFLLKKLLFIAGVCLGMRKKIVVRQLKLCFPEKTDQEIKILTANVYEELAVSVAEIFVFNDKYFENRKISIGFDNIEKALSYNRGVMIVSAHFSNWEMGAKSIAEKYPPVYGVVKNQRNTFFNKYLDNKRTQNGLATIPMQNALKHIVSALKNNQVVAFLIDQYARKQGVDIDFLGHKTKTYTSVAQIAIKYKVPVIMAFDVRDKKGFHKIIFHEPLIFENIPYNEKNILDISKKINHYIEGYIKEYPELWFWVHRKWR